MIRKRTCTIQYTMNWKTEMATHITAAMLYDFVRCPHRVTNDLFGNPADRDPVSPFVQ